MNDRSFDELTRSLGAATSRRQMLKIATGTVLGGLGAMLGRRSGSTASANECARLGERCGEDRHCCDHDDVAHRDALVCRGDSDSDDRRRTCRCNSEAGFVACGDKCCPASPPTQAEIAALLGPCPADVKSHCVDAAVDRLIERGEACRAICQDPNSTQCLDCVRPLVNQELSSLAECLIKRCSGRSERRDRDDSATPPPADVAVLLSGLAAARFADMVPAAGPLADAASAPTCGPTQETSCQGGAVTAQTVRTALCLRLGPGGRGVNSQRGCLSKAIESYLKDLEECRRGQGCPLSCYNCQNGTCVSNCGAGTACTPDCIGPVCGALCCPNDQVCAGTCCKAGECCSGGHCVAQCPSCTACRAGQCVTCAGAGLCCTAAFTGTCVASQHCPDGCCNNGVCGCPNGKLCRSGQCVPDCSLLSCAQGCCDAGVCLAYANQSTGSCGSSGATCAACPSGATCQSGHCVCTSTGQPPVNGQCVGCNSTTCPQGCCDASGNCVLYSSQGISQCGTGGAACAACQGNCANGQCTSAGLAGSWNWTDFCPACPLSGFNATATFAPTSPNSYSWGWGFGWSGTATVSGATVTVHGAGGGFSAVFTLTLSGTTLTGTWHQSDGQDGTTVAHKI